MSSRPYVAEIEGSPEKYARLIVNTSGDLKTTATISGPVTVTGGLTDAQLRASPVPVTVNQTGFSSVLSTRPSVSNVSSVALSSNASRKYAMIYNQSGSTVFLHLGSGSAVAQQGIRLANNSSYEITSINLFTGQISAIKTGGGSVNLDIFEGS